MNEVGRGPWSEEVAFWTCGTPPPPPAPPTLGSCDSNSLVVYWDRRPGDDYFTLQMEDKNNQHGFIAAYTGREVETKCEGLMRYSNYVFRLQAHNEDGGSRWSEEVMFRTLPERPGPPTKLSVKGKIHAQSFKVRWDPPVDRGGTDIQHYTLELKSNSEFEKVYTGAEQEAVCDRLKPGNTYHLRVSCTSAGGVSGWSDVQSVTTEAVVPGACSPPSLSGEPRPHSISIKWNKPDYDGGSPILEYNVEISQEENSRLVYKGNETECTVHELLPGRQYSFKVKALNKTGGGPWSESLVVTSGPAPPEHPPNLTAVAKSPFSIHVQWEEPPCNGGPITDYRLEMTVSNDDEKIFFQVFNGLQQSYDVKNLTPYTRYSFRVCASNKAGHSDWSEEESVITPAAVPAAPPALRAEATASDAALAWQEPDSNGSPISHYRIDIGERVFHTEGPILEFNVKDLLPETTYRVRVQAVNEIGIGNFSPTLKFETLPPPPSPPPLHCVQQGHNFLKLKWGDGKNPDFTQYSLEMQSPRRKEYACVYQGTGLSSELRSSRNAPNIDSGYAHKVMQVGQGEFSEPVEWETAPAPPITLRAPRQLELSEHSSLIEWAPPKGLPEEPLTFVVQCCRSKEQDYKQVYRGTETSMRIEELEGGCEYSVRVCAEREVDGRALQGAWSPALILATPTPAPMPAVPSSTLSAAPRRATRKSQPAPMTDRQWALLLVAGFFFVVVIFAIAVEHFIDWRSTA